MANDGNTKIGAQGPQQYTRAQFEHAFRSLTQMLHAVAFLDLDEIARWIQIVTAPDQIGQVELTDDQRRGVANVLQLIENMKVFKGTLQETGIPPVPPMQVNPNNPDGQVTPNSEVPSAKPQ